MNDHHRPGWRRPIHDAFVLVAVLAGCEPAAPSPEPAPPALPGAGPVETGSPEAVPAEPELTAEGWGPLRIGMTRAEVVEALGGPDPGVVTGPEPEACEEFSPGRAPEGLLVMLERGVLTRITLFDPATIETEHGFAVGDEAEVIQRALGDAVQATPHKYVAAPAAYLTVWSVPPSAAEPRGIVYEIGEDGRVQEIHAGGPSIQYVEGCL